jgi:hypothetical protein
MELVNELTHILMDPAHWVAEGVMDTAFAAVAWFVGGRFAVRRHDVKVHGKTDPR